MPHYFLYRFFFHDQSTCLLCKTIYNFNSDYSNVLTIQIDFYFPKLYFSLLRALYTLENLSSNFITIFRHMPHIVRKMCCVFKHCKIYSIPIFKALNLRECLQYSLRYIIHLFIFYIV